MIIDTLITNLSVPKNDLSNRSRQSTKQNINQNLITYIATLQKNSKLLDEKNPSSYWILETIFLSILKHIPLQRFSSIRS